MLCYTSILAVCTWHFYGLGLPELCRPCCAILIISVCTLQFHFGMDVQVGRRKTPDGPLVAEWYPRVFVTNSTLAMAIDPGEVEVGGEDGAEEEAEDAHVQPT